jgi:predicted acyl esterase
MLRALHRREQPAPDNHRTSWPYHGCARADAAPLVPGEPALIRFALLPVSWTFRRGSRIRLALAGADCDQYGQVPHGRPPRLAVQRGGAMASHLELPWEAASLHGKD